MVEDYHGEASGSVDEGESNQIEFPVNNGVIGISIEYSLVDAGSSALEEDTVTLRLTDADGAIIQEEADVSDGDGTWSYSSDDLSSTGDYVFSIIAESGSMEYEVFIDVSY